MANIFAVRTSSHYERLSSRLYKNHKDFETAEHEAAVILSVDPYNQSRTHNIKKLEGTSVGEGQYRIRLRHWRFRYDILGNVVIMVYCGLRRENTY